MTKFALISIVLLTHIFSLPAQPQADSLRSLLENSSTDKEKYRNIQSLVNYYSNNNYNKALHYARMELKMAEQEPEQYSLAAAYQHMGYLLSYLEKQDSAIYFLRKGLEIASRDSTQRYSDISSTLGSVYFEIGAHQKALTHYFDVIELYNQTENEAGKAKMYNHIANTYVEMGYFDKAEEYQKESLAYFEKMNNKPALIALYNNMGNLYGNQKAYDKAHIYFRKCLNISKELNHVAGQAVSLSNIGENYIRQNKYAIALDTLLIAEQLLLSNNSTYNLSGIKNSIGAAYLKLQNFNKAEQYLNEAKALAEKSQSKRQQRGIYKDLSELYESQNKFDKALSAFKNYSDIKDSLLTEEKAGQIANMRIKYETERIEEQLKTTEKEKENQRIILIIITMLIAIGLIASYAIFRNYRLKQKSRFDQLSKQHLELSLRFLRSQLNPHFIFNALSSIQSLIVDADYKTANKYLGKFGQLLRNILENSRNETIALSDEIEITKLYMELEQMRHANSFDFEFKVSENIDQQEIYIPPMIFQPFVENAILHGLATTKTGGLISIQIKLTAQCLVCEIYDNGMGINSTLMNREIDKKHISRGVQIVKERLEKFQTNRNALYEVSMIDRTTIDAESKGTLVTIQMPFEERF